MTCPKCNAPIDESMKSCAKCRDKLAVSQEMPTPKKKRYWTLGRVLFWLFVINLSSCLLYPAGHDELKPNMAAVAARGRDIYHAIVAREGIGLPSIWPKTSLVGTNLACDISGRTFKTSTEYFEALLNSGTDGVTNRNSFVRGFDCSKLAGAGVPCCPPGQRLTAANNMWLIAANITDEDSDIIPVMITRNVDVKEIERYINHGGSRAPDDTRIELGKGEYKTPFGKKGFVCVRKGGGTFANQAKYATLRVIFNAETLPPRDPSKPPIVYLMP